MNIVINKFFKFMTLKTCDNLQFSVKIYLYYIAESHLYHILDLNI